MARPTPYKRSFSFKDFASRSPSSPPPGASLDAEYDAVQRSVSQLIASLSRIQRDDGALANGTVSVDTLASDVLFLIVSAGFKMRGAWVAGTSYGLGDVFVSETIVYLTVAPHTAGVLAADVAADRVVPIFDSANTGLGASLSAADGAGLIGTADGATVQAALAALADDIATKTDRFPSNYDPALARGFTRVMGGFYRWFYDKANGRLRPCEGAGGSPNWGLPDTAASPSSWMRTLGVNTLYWHWRYLKRSGDTTGAASVAAQIASDWAYYQTKYTPAQIKAGSGSIVNANDDASLHAKMLSQVHEVTGDANALAYLVEFIPANNLRWHDANQVMIDYGVTTPGGVAFKSDPLGGLYSIGNLENTTQEVVTALAAVYVSQQPTSGTLTAAMKAAMLQYAKNTWTWMFTYARASKGAAAPVNVAPAPAIYAASITLDPASANYRKAARFGGNVDAPVRGQSAWADGMTLAMANLSLKLFAITTTTSYLAEAQAIVTSYAAPNGFGRKGPGDVPILANARDPWVNGSEAPGYVFADYFDISPTPGVPITGAAAGPLAIGFYNTAQVICSAVKDGYSTPDWNGDEYCPLTGYHRWTDDGGAGGQSNDPNQDYGGYGGGGQANPRQLMTSATIVSMAHAGVLLEPYMQAVGSGLSTRQSIERVPARLAALEIASSLAFPRSGGFISGPFGMDTQFYLNRNSNPYINWANGYLLQFNRAAPKWEFYGGGSNILTVAPGEVSVIDTLKFNTRLTSNFFASYGPGPYINFDTNSYLQFITASYSFVIGGNVVLSSDGNGTLRMKGNVVPLGDNTASLGLPANRFSQVFAGTPTINTSDARQKTVRGALTPAELAAAAEISKAVVVYRYNDAVAEKGSAARLHAGFIAQAVFDTFTRHGLDPERYGACCHDAWDEIAAEPAVAAVDYQPAVIKAGSVTVQNPQGTVLREAVQAVPARAAVPGRTAGDLYSLRLDELWAFLTAANEQRFAQLESRLASLEAAA